MLNKIVKFFKPYTPLQKKYLSFLMIFRADFPFLGRGISNGYSFTYDLSSIKFYMDFLMSKDENKDNEMPIILLAMWDNNFIDSGKPYYKQKVTLHTFIKHPKGYFVLIKHDFEDLEKTKETLCGRFFNNVITEEQLFQIYPDIYKYNSHENKLEKKLRYWE